MKLTMRPTYATTFLISVILFSQTHSTVAILSSLANLAKGAVSGLANAIGIRPSSTLSSDPKVAFKQLPDILKKNNMQEYEIDLDKALQLEQVQKIYDQAKEEIKAKLPERTEPLV